MSKQNSTLFGALIGAAFTISSLLPGVAHAADSSVTLRPPAVPLIACDPYFSLWSPADKLTDADTVHWTGKRQRLNSSVTIDGKKFSVMGRALADAPALKQTSVNVLPTRTIYTFEASG